MEYSNFPRPANIFGIASYLIWIVLQVLITLPVGAQTRVPLQPFAQQVRQVETSLAYLGQPLAQNDADAINQAIGNANEAGAIERLSANDRALPGLQAADSISGQRSHWNRAESLSGVHGCGRVADYSGLLVCSRFDHVARTKKALRARAPYPTIIGKNEAVVASHSSRNVSATECSE